MERNLSLHVPNKVKNLMWSACRNSLPTKQNLVHRKIIECPFCDHCKQVPKSTLHALWTCQALDVVWENEDLWSCRRNNFFMDFKELLSWFIKHQQNVELFFFTAWSVWTQQNQVRLNQLSYSSHLIASVAKERLEEFLVVQPPPWLCPLVVRS